MKLYNEKEIGSILKRAAELSHDDAGSNAMGLSIDELKQLGKEAGINPDFILRAATEMGAQTTRSSGKNFYGGPVSYSNEMRLDHEITASDWEEMLAKIRMSFGDPGIVSTRENTFEWTIQHQSTKAQVTARSENGKTNIHVFWSEPAAPIPFYIPTLIGTIISLPIFEGALQLSAVPGIAAVLTTMASLFFLGRWGLSTYSNRHCNKLDQLMTELELVATQGRLSSNKNKATTPGETAKLAAPEPELPNILDMDDEVPSSDRAQTAKRERN